jgi:hypothetical protein
MMMNGKVTSYLQKGRLADVLSLIQLLAFDESGYRSEEGMVTDLGRKPISATSWIDLAEAHPEFFRVRSQEGRKARAALIIRYIVGKIAIDGEDRRPPLAPEFVSNFFQLAINLHDKQVLHRDRWKPWLFGFLGAGLAATGTVAAAYIKLLSGG